MQSSGRAKRKGDENGRTSIILWAEGMTAIVFKGHPGTGKSFLATRLARRFKAALLDKDDVKAHLTHLEDSNALALDILWKIMETQVALGLHCIIDTTLSRPEHFERVGMLPTFWGSHHHIDELHLGTKCMQDASCKINCGRVLHIRWENLEGEIGREGETEYEHSG